MKLIKRLLKQAESKELQSRNIELLDKAKGSAKSLTKKAKKKGKGTARSRVEKLKGRKEKIDEKKKEFKIKIYGEIIQRKIEKGKAVFISKEGKKIKKLSEWIKKRSEDIKRKKIVNKNIKPFVDRLTKLTEKDRDKEIQKINKMSVHQLQNGANKLGIITEDPIVHASKLAKVVMKKTGTRSFKISPDLNKKIKRHSYLDYPHVLPPSVRTIVVTRNGKKIICMRKIGLKNKGGRISYIDVVTGKKVLLKQGDGVDIIGTLSTQSKEYRDLSVKERAYAMIRIKKGYAWDKTKEDPERVSKVRKVKARGGYTGGGYRGGGYTGGGYSGGGTGRGAGGGGRVERGPTPAPLVPATTLDQSPEELSQQATQHTFEIPGARYMFASMLLPKKKMKGKPKLLIYFSGRGHYKAIKSWYKNKGRRNKPPLEVLAEAAREDFLSSRKRIFSMLKERWEKGENISLVLVSHMRPYLHPDKKESGRSKYWYNEFRNASGAQNVIGTIQQQYEKKTGYKAPNDMHLSGHSMGGKVLASLIKLKRKGQIPYNASYFFSDASYWGFPLDEFEKGTPIYLSYIPGEKSKTKTVAGWLIRRFRLKGHAVGRRKVIYTNPKYPNIRVVKAYYVHSSHPGHFMNSGFQLAENIKEGRKVTTGTSGVA